VDMENRKITDWKDIASGFYDQAFSLAILFMLFAVLVSPQFEVKARVFEAKEQQAIEIPPEIKEKIKPPEETVKPVIRIVVDDEMDGDDDEDIEIIDTIESTTLDPYEEVEDLGGKLGTTSKFAVYEDAPVAIKRVPPVYPDFVKKMGIEGDVWLEVEVFANGKVGAIEVKKSLMSGPGGLDEAAIKAVRQWEFNPAKSGGQPVACWVTFPITFNLN